MAGGDLGLRNLSKIAITRNIEMRMAVATNPNETALTESSKRLQYSSLSGFKGDTAGNAGAIAPHFCSPPIKTKPQLSNNKKKTHSVFALSC